MTMRLIGHNNFETDKSFQVFFWNQRLTNNCLTIIQIKSWNTISVPIVSDLYSLHLWRCVSLATIISKTTKTAVICNIELDLIDVWNCLKHSSSSNYFASFRFKAQKVIASYLFFLPFVKFCENKKDQKMDCQFSSTKEIFSWPFLFFGVKTCFFLWYIILSC